MGGIVSRMIVLSESLWRIAVHIKANAVLSTLLQGFALGRFEIESIGGTHNFLYRLAYCHAGHAELDSASRIDTLEGEFWIPNQVRYDYKKANGFSSYEDFNQ
jgi:hypothetical protein